MVISLPAPWLTDTVPEKKDFHCRLSLDCLNEVMDLTSKLNFEYLVALQDDLSGRHTAKDAKETKSHGTQCTLVRFASFSEACRAMRSCNFYLLRDTVISMRLLP